MKHVVLLHTDGCERIVEFVIKNVFGWFLLQNHITDPRHCFGQLTIMKHSHMPRHDKTEHSPTDPDPFHIRNHGDPIRRRKLALELGVSVSPVGEAMLQLELEGLIKTRPRQGTYVVEVTQKDLNDQMRVRLAVECQAARLYCGDQIRANFERLHQLALELDRTDHKTVDYAVRDTQFHRELVCLAGSKGLLKVYDRVMRLGLLLADYAKGVPGSRKGDHRRLLAELQTDGPDEAEAVIRKNICGSKRLLHSKPAKSQNVASSTEKRMEKSMNRVVKSRKSSRATELK